VEIIFISSFSGLIWCQVCLEIHHFEMEKSQSKIYIEIRKREALIDADIRMTLSKSLSFNLVFEDQIIPLYSSEQMREMEKLSFSILSYLIN